MARVRARDRKLATISSDFGKLAEGIALFNAKEFFRAHEVWEELWFVSRGNDKKFLQGLIQLAAAFHHQVRGNSSGAASLLKTSCAKLAEFPDLKWGIDLRDLRDRLNEWQTALLENRNAESIQLPRIQLRRG